MWQGTVGPCRAEGGRWLTVIKKMNSVKILNEFGSRFFVGQASLQMRMHLADTIIETLSREHTYGQSGLRAPENCEIINECRVKSVNLYFVMQQWKTNTDSSIFTMYGFFKKNTFIFREIEKEREHKRERQGRKEKDSQAASAPNMEPDPEILTWAETNSWMFSGLCHPGAPIIYGF